MYTLQKSCNNSYRSSSMKFLNRVCNNRNNNSNRNTQSERRLFCRYFSIKWTQSREVMSDTICEFFSLFSFKKASENYTFLEKMYNEDTNADNSIIPKISVFGDGFAYFKRILSCKRKITGELLSLKFCVPSFSNRYPLSRLFSGCHVLSQRR